ncbi:putative N-acetyltransferase YsnE [compost metagenome]
MHDNGVGELKRMFTRPEVRGKRVGSLLVDAIVELARARGISRLVLETGTGPGFDGAWRLYENSGFVRCGVVLDYPDSEYSAFFEKRLVEA